MQLTPTMWSAHATDGDGDGVADPDDLFDAAATTAETLCTSGLDLEHGQRPANEPSTGCSATRHRLRCRSERPAATPAPTGLDLGEVPADPRAVIADGMPQFDDERHRSRTRATSSA